jgi:dTDP-4-amino-4,6-dideoxygalactose transaminase
MLRKSRRGSRRKPKRFCRFISTVSRPTWGRSCNSREARPVVIEDASQAHAARYEGRRAGNLGHLGCFSFYPTKNLGAFGEAGAVVTDNAEYATAVRMLRDWGQEAKYKHVRRGFNHRMEGLQGVVLRTKLRHLSAWTAARRRLAARYDDELASLARLRASCPPRARLPHYVTCAERARIQQSSSTWIELRFTT